MFTSGRKQSLVLLLFIGSLLYAGLVSAEHIHIDDDALQCSICISADNHKFSATAAESFPAIERHYAAAFTQTQVAYRNQPVTFKRSRAPPHNL